MIDLEEEMKRRARRRTLIELFWIAVIYGWAIVLLVSCGQYKPEGIVYPDEVRAWKAQVDRLVELQAEAWGDPEWPHFLATRTTVLVLLTTGPFDCSGTKASGCTVLAPYAPAPNAWQFDVWLSRAHDVQHTALGYELGHVYAQTHGIPDDDSYTGDFWDKTQAALDKWGAER